MSRPIALIIDDEPDIRELLEITLGRMKIETRAAADLREAKQFLASERFDLCLTDMRLPDGDGLDLVKLIGKKYPDLPVAVITAHGNMNSAVESLKAGAFDFVSKPVDLQILRNLVKSALKLESDSRPEERSSSNENQAEKLLGKSPVTKQIGSMIQKLARSQAPVYVSGESGTGKELAARLIHAQGPKSKAPFIAVNCGAIPQELVESEFFGHKKGSFTGAVDDKQGLFQAAQGGTLFLDEVADLPLQMQVKLLRSIQEKRVRPVGAAEEHPVDVRIISATHKDLGHMVEQGTFRQDLFYRINVIELRIPPLRERQEDIPVLTDSILAKQAALYGQKKPKIERDALQQLMNYPFPGNVRELENILERATTLCEEGRIKRSDLQLNSRDQSLPVADPDLPLEACLEKVERDIISNALETTRWNRTAAAKKLGISFRQLRYRLQKLGLDKEQ